MPYRACVFQHRSDYTDVHSKQITLSDTSALQLVNTKNTIPSLGYNRINMGVPTADNVTPNTLACVTRSMSLSYAE